MQPDPRAPEHPGRAWAEGALAVALLAVPLYFTVFTFRVFEAEKAVLLRWLGLIALIGLGLARQEARGEAGRRTRLARALAWAVAAAVLTEAVSALLSVAPWTSALGSRVRGQGLATTMALGGMALAAAGWARREGGDGDLARLLGFSALPAALYALSQAFGLDPLPWEGDVVTRVVGPAGASPLLAAHLVMALPFAGLEVASAWRSGARGRLAAWLAAVAVGSAALVLSAGRGALIGLAAGLWVLGLGWAAARAAAGGAGDGRPRRLAMALVGAAVAGALLLGALNGGRPAFLARLPVLERLVGALDPERSTTRVRMRLWEGSALASGDLLGLGDGASGWRSLVGYGPETMDLVWAPYYPPLLAYDEPRGYLPDRAHSLALDLMLTRGLLGLAAEVAVLALAVALALRLLGLGGGALRTAALTAASGAGLAGLAVLGLDGPWCLARSAWPAGACLMAPAAGLGAVLGLGLGLAWRAVRPGRAAGAPASGSIFAAAALVALVAHGVELQVGFASGASRLWAWVIAGALVGLAGRAAGHRLSASPVPPGRAALATGLALAFSLARLGQVAGGPVVAGLLIAAGAAGAWFAFAPQGKPGAGRVAGLVAVYTAAHVILLDALTRGAADALLAVGLTLALLAAGLALVAAPAPLGRRSAVAAAAAVLLALPLALPTLADAAAKEGQLGWQAVVSRLREDGQSGKAESYLRRAVDRYLWARALAPWEPEYALAEARARVEWADLLDARARRRAFAPEDGGPDLPAVDDDPVGVDAPLGGAVPESSGVDEPEADAARWRAERDQSMALALAAVDVAERLAPGSPIPELTRARTYRIWAARTVDVEPDGARLRRERFEAAMNAYARAAARAPGWPELLDEAALTALAAGDAPRARDLALRAAREVDPFFRRAWRTAAQAYLALDEPEPAVSAYAAYFVDWRNAADVAGRRGQLQALERAGHEEAALSAARDLVRLAPGEAGAHADLAVLLDEAGDRPGARESAAAALAIAPEDAAIRALADRLGVED